MVHAASVLVGLAICGVGLAVFATGGHLGPLDVPSLTSGLCGGFPCPYSGGAVGGIVVLAGLGYLLRGLTAPSTPAMPMGFPPIPGFMGQMPFGPGGGAPPGIVGSDATPAVVGAVASGHDGTTPGGAPSPTPAVFCSSCGSRNAAEAAFCFKCGRAIARV